MFQLWVLTSSIAVADPLVILNGTESRTDEIEKKVPDTAEFLTWEELREFPLAFGAVKKSESCLGMEVPLQDLEVALQSASSAIAYLDTENALGFIRKIENGLTCVKEPAPKSLLEQTSYLAGVAHLYDDDVKLARQKWKQALMFNPDLTWDEGIEPTGKPVFQEIKEEVAYQASTRLIFMPSTAILTIDGATPKSGDSIVAGEHLVQHNALNYQSHRVETERGNDAYVVSFADFSADLNAVMADQAKRDEMLKALLMIQDKSDIRVVTATDYWYLPMGTTKWKSQALKTVPKSPKPTRAAEKVIKQKELPPAVEKQPKTAKVPRQRADAKKPFLYAGAGAVVLGATSFAVSNGYRNTLEGYDGSQSFTQYETTFNNHRGYWFAGAGLTAVGSGLVLWGTF